MLRELGLLRGHARRYRSAYVLGATCLVVSILLKVLIPAFVGDGIDTLRGLDSHPDAHDRALVAGRIARLVLLTLTSATLVAAFRTASRLLILGTSRRAIHDLREGLFDKLLELSPSFYMGKTTGGIMSRGVNDVTYVQSLLGPVFLYLAETGVLYAFCLAFMGTISVELTLLGFAPFPFFVWAARRQAARIQRGSRAAQETLGDISAKVDESLSGHAIVKSLTLEEFDLERFRRHCDEYRRLNLEVAWARGTLMPMMMGLASLSVFVVLVLGGPRVVRHELSLGDFVRMVFYMQMMAAPTGALGFVISSLQRGTAALSRLREVFDAPVTLRDPEDAVPDAIREGRVEVRDLSMELGSPVSVDGDGARSVLRHVSFEAPAGSTVGIVGHTGSGKSVLVSVLARQLEVPDGHVFVDGTDVNRITLEEYRQSVGYVPQEAFLFGKTLAENVALGDPHAARERVEQAVRVAQLEKDLPQLPDGLDTVLGERGVNLSGGQRQRTALARVVLLQPKILILDDTLSAVDATTAEDILEGLRPLMHERTTLVVSHRVATVREADLILVLEEGRIVERGTHGELVARGGIYARMHAHQSRHESLARELGLRVEEAEGRT